MQILKVSSVWRTKIPYQRFLSSSSSTVQEFEISLPNCPKLRISHGKLAKFADGRAVATLGDTSVLTTAVCKNKPVSGSGGTTPVTSFVPLTVDYRQKSAAAGRIPTNFLRREMGPTEREILTSRMIDRSIRPLFPKGFGLETQLVCNLLAVDGLHDPDIVAINAASASLALSNIPWSGPVGGVRVGYANSKFILNPTRKQLASSLLNLVVSGDRFSKAIMMESAANNIEKSLFVDAIEFALENCAQIAQVLYQESQHIVKRALPPALDIDPELIRDMQLMCAQKVTSICQDTSHDKVSRDTATFAVRDQAFKELRENYPNVDVSVFHQCFNQICRDVIAQMVLNEGQRVDGRDKDSLRNISCEYDLHDPLHGSALFQRGQTQVFCTVSLDSLESSLKTDSVSILTGAIKEKNFFLHYEFPPYATNDIGRTTFGRRELGHGALAEKALMSVIPKDFPFTIRLTSEVLESNGSSSMASVCGGSLALLDAGVPISESVAGVAVGLISRWEGEDIQDYATLLDILGLEDYLGDMDFKIAGTASGITALQADVKIPGLPLKVIKEAVQKGYTGICQILQIMSNCIEKPRNDKKNLPVSKVIHVPKHKRSRFVGPGGINLKKLMSDTGVQVTSSDEGSFNAFAPNSDAMDEADEVIEMLLEDVQTYPEYEFGAILTVKIVEILEKGIRVEMHPNMDPVFIGINQLSARKVVSTSALEFEVGQSIQVKHFGRDPQSGMVRLSRKALTVASSSAVRSLSKSARSSKSEDIVNTNSNNTGDRTAVSKHSTRLVKNMETKIITKPIQEKSSVNRKEKDLDDNPSLDNLSRKVVKAESDVKEGINALRQHEAEFEDAKQKSKRTSISNYPTYGGQISKNKPVKGYASLRFRGKSHSLKTQRFRKGCVKSVMNHSIRIQVFGENSSKEFEDIFVPHSLLRTKRELHSGDIVLVEYLEVDQVTGKRQILVHNSDYNAANQTINARTEFENLKKRDKWSSLEYDNDDS